MKSTYKEEEAIIQKALHVYESQKKEKSRTNIAKIARDHGISYHRLHRRIQGKKSKITRKPANQRLDPAQYEALFDYIDRYDDVGAPISIPAIRKAANTILQNSHEDSSKAPPKVGKNWPYRFLQQNKQYFKGKRRVIDIDRAEAEDEVLVSQWYNYLQLQTEIYSFLDEDIWNFDETGFRIGQGRVESIVTQYPTRNNDIASASTRTTVTLVECVNSTGERIPPVLIIPGKVHLQDWYTLSDLPDDYIIEVSEKGYINGAIAFSWLYHFNYFSAQRQRGRYRLLLMDNHEAHLTVEFVQYCQDHRILLLSFPPHLTHRLQPLDSVPFQQLKLAHGLAVNSVSRFRGEKYDKLEFLYDIDKIRKRALTERTIRAGWREVGIRPWNPSLILQKIAGRTVDEEEPLKIYNNSHIIENFEDISASNCTITTTTTTTTVQRTPSPLLDKGIKTPTTLRSIRKEIMIVRRSKTELSPTIDRIFRGALTQAEQNAMTSVALDEALESRKRPSNSTTRSRRTVKMDGL